MESKALGQEPCEDTINRQDALKIVDDMLMGERDHKQKAYEEIKNLPPVHPKPKTGRWIGEGFYLNGSNVYIHICSKCGGRVLEYPIGVYVNNPYCRFCGAKMTESEDNG